MKTKVGSLELAVSFQEVHGGSAVICYMVLDKYLTSQDLNRLRCFDWSVLGRSCLALKFYKYIKYIPKLEKKLNKGTGYGKLGSFVLLLGQVIAVGVIISEII